MIACLEISLKIYFKSTKIPTENRFKFRFMLYSEGKLFDKHKDFFKYHPNLLRRNLQFYYKDDKFVKIWDYNFQTNNFGLVQSSDIYPEKKSILFLGDSFTEGQGAPPWIDKFGESFLGYQVINGGIVGTGFRQFENIYNHINKEFNIEKIVVIYIGGDLRRGISLASDSNILKIPKQEHEINNFLINQYNVRTAIKENFKNKLKFLIRDTYLYNLLRTQINTFRLRNNLSIKKNFQSIENLYEKNSSNIIFINIPMAYEVLMKQESYETKLLNKFFLENKFPNFKCDMSNDISNFHEIDFHPNQKGYNEIFKCVKNIIEENLIKN